MSAHAPGIFNDIVGPVMRGPSSSHTAGSFHIAVMARALLGAPPVRARCRFDPAGSYAQVYRQQGVDRAYAVGLLGWPLTDVRFFDALDEAAAAGLALLFSVEPLAGADHPNTVDIELASADGRVARLRAKSVGGGAVEVTSVDDWPVRLTGETVLCAGRGRGRLRSGGAGGNRGGRGGRRGWRLPRAGRRAAARGAARDVDRRRPPCRPQGQAGRRVAAGGAARGVRQARSRAVCVGLLRWWRWPRRGDGRSAGRPWPTKRTCSGSTSTALEAEVARASISCGHRFTRLAMWYPG